MKYKTSRRWLAGRRFATESLEARHLMAILFEIPNYDVTLPEGIYSVDVADNPIVEHTDPAGFHGGQIAYDILNRTPSDRIGQHGFDQNVDKFFLSDNILYRVGTPFEEVGSFTGGWDAPLLIQLGDTISADDVREIVDNLALYNVSENPVEGQRVMQITLTDSSGQTATQTSTVHVFPVSDIPQVDFVTGAIYQLGMPPALLAPQATVTDVDSPRFEGGSIRLSFEAGGQAGDHVAIWPSIENEIDVSGSSVLYRNTVIANISGGTVDEPLVISLNQAATRAAVQSLWRTITFSTSDETSLAIRSLQYVFNDGDGGETEPEYATVVMLPKNAMPVIRNLSPQTYVLGAQSIDIAPSAALADDDLTYLTGGQLTISLANATANDYLDIRGSGALESDGFELTFQGEVFGYINGGVAGSALQINFVGETSEAAIVSVLRAVTFRSTESVPKDRRIFVSLRDNLDSPAVAETIAISMQEEHLLPVIVPASDQVLVRPQEEVAITPADRFLYPKSTSYVGATLTVAWTTGATATDLLSISNSLGITLQGTELLQGGTTVGTFAGGSNGTSLVITFNDHADPSVIESVVRSLAYRSDEPGQVDATKTLTLAVGLLDGSASETRVLQVLVSASAPEIVVNQAPSLTTAANVDYQESTPAIRFISSASDFDSPNLAGGLLEFKITSGGTSNDRLQIRPGNGITVAGRQLSFGGTLIGSYWGGVGSEPLRVFPNANATPAMVEQLIPLIGYRRLGEFAATDDVTIASSWWDGDGPAAEVSQTVVHLQVSDTPAVLYGARPLVAQQEQASDDSLSHGQPQPIFTTFKIVDPDNTSYQQASLRVHGVQDAFRDFYPLIIYGKGPAQFSRDSSANLYFNGVQVAALNQTYDGYDFLPNTSIEMIERVIHSYAAMSNSRPPTGSYEVQFELVTNNGPVMTTRVPVTMTHKSLGAILQAIGNITVTDENAPPMVMVSKAQVWNYDSLSAAAGELRIEVVADAHPESQIGIQNVGDGAGELGVVGDSLTYGGIQFATFSGGVGSDPLVVKLGANATTQMATAVLRNATFVNRSDDPPHSQIVSFTFIDDEEDQTEPAFTNVNIKAVNDPAKLEVATVADYLEADSDVLLDPNAQVLDPDSQNFNRGTLTVQLNQSAPLADEISLLPDQAASFRRFALTDSSVVTIDGIQIGQRTGGSAGVPLRIQFNANASRELVEKLVRHLTFRPSSNVDGLRTLKLSIDDGDGGLSTPVTTQVNVTNRAPNLDTAKTPTLGTIQEDAKNPAGTLITSLTIGITDLDAGDPKGIAVTSVPTGGGVWQYTLNGTTWMPFPTVSETSALLLPASSTARVRFLPAANFSGNRTLNFRAWDQTAGTASGVLNATTNRGGAKSISNAKDSAVLTINPVNDPPVVGNLGSILQFVENQSMRTLASVATLVDPDGADFGGGILTVRLASGGDANDRLEIRDRTTVANRIGVSGSKINYNGQTVGTFTGGSGASPLQVTLDSSATLAITQALIRSITFRTLGDTPATTQRSIEFKLSDGDGGTSNAITKLVSVAAINDRPVLALGGTTTYTENQPARVLSTTTTVSDVDSANFAGGSLTVRISQNAEGSDQLAILSQGSGPGQIDLQGSNVRFGGAVIGTFAGGAGNQALVVSYNASATPTAVQALARAITYRNFSDTPSTLQRKITWILNDGDGSVGLMATKLVNVTATNDSSTLSGSTTELGYSRNSAGILVASTLAVADPDSPDFAGGRLLVSITSGANAANRVEVSSAFSFSGTDVNYTSGSTALKIGSRNSNGGVGTTNLAVTFDSSATLAIVNSLLKNLRFRTEGLAPGAAPSRTLSFNLTDGDGGTSNTVTKVVSIN